MMSKRDYTLIAQALYRTKPSTHQREALEAWHKITREIAKTLQEDSYVFDIFKFRKAALQGPTHNKGRV